MPITASDIKLLASERMADTSDGGGRRTGNVILDGVAGNIFPKVARTDSVYGRVNLRKIYGGVQTASRDTYAGAHAIIADAPNNPKIHAALFSTGSDFDDRTAARDRIESYVIAGPESRMTMYGRQLVGQMAVLAYQRVEDTLPEVGEVFCLSKELAGVVQAQQYVRVTGVTHEIRMLADSYGDFSRRIVTLQIGSPLRYEFLGPDTPTRFSSVERPTLIRRTSVADAARYFGIRPVAQPADAGALMVKVDSVYTPIVPTTVRETAVANAEIGSALQVVPAGTDLIGHARYGDAFPSGINTRKTQTISLRAAIKPGSLRIRMFALVSKVFVGPEVTDDGDGNINVDTGDLWGRVYGGTVDYESGTITVDAYYAGLPPGGAFQDGMVSINYIRAVAVGQPAHTLALPVTLETRGTVLVQTLHPIPAPGTLFVEFRALGKWYRLTDDGTGALAGDDPLHGTGSIDYATGSVIATLGALPDVGSSNLFSWGSPAHYTIRAGATSDAGATVDQRIMLTALPVKPGSVVIHYTSGVTVNTATEVAGVISGGNVTGTVDHATGEVLLRYASKLPNMGSTVTVNYVQQVASGATPTSVGGVITVTDPADIDLATVIEARGLKIGFVASVSTGGGFTRQGMVYAADDGAGALKTLSQDVALSGGVSAFVAGGQACGTVNYATGAVTITGCDAGIAMWLPQLQVQGSGGGVWTQVSRPMTPVAADYSYTIKTGAASTDVAQVVAANPQTDSPVYVDLTRTLAHAVVPGSVVFDIAGLSYIERNGVLYSSVQSDGSGTPSGTINYVSGRANLTQWVDNTVIALTVRACLTQWGDFTAVDASFRTAGSPVRPASLYVQATSVAGDVLTATSDEAGVLTGSFARGSVNHAMGSGFIEWGEMVLAAGNETERWYDADAVVGGMIWRPLEVLPGTIRYNCVVLSNLPLNADQLGLDPVRLPSDGRVPIYRPADVVVIHNTKSYALPNPAVAGATYNMGRTDLSDLWLTDATGARVPTTHYVADPAAGTVTMDAALDLTGILQPLTARHRIEEMNLLSDVQIDGQLSLTAQLQRDYDGDTFVSSALLFGDMVSRVTGVFDQVTWTGVWSDARIGANGVGEYNTIDYPITVLNNGAVTERWRINFTTTTAFQVIGENLGVIATGTTAADVSPVNALTGLPYFTLRAAGWGGGWAAVNQLRFNTVGATAPIWIARTVLPGATLDGDSLDLQLRGDVDA